MRPSRPGSRSGGRPPSPPDHRRAGTSTAPSSRPRRRRRPNAFGSTSAVRVRRPADHQDEDEDRDDHLETPHRTAASHQADPGFLVIHRAPIHSSASTTSSRRAVPGPWMFDDHRSGFHRRRDRPAEPSNGAGDRVAVPHAPSVVELRRRPPRGPPTSPCPRSDRRRRRAARRRRRMRPRWPWDRSPGAPARLAETKAVGRTAAFRKIVSPPAGTRSRSTCADRRASAPGGDRPRPRQEPHAERPEERSRVLRCRRRTARSTIDSSSSYPGPERARPSSSATRPFRSVNPNRTVSSPASASPIGSPPGAGKGSPFGDPSHRTRKAPRRARLDDGPRRRQAARTDLPLGERHLERLGAQTYADHDRRPAPRRAGGTRTPRGRARWRTWRARTRRARPRPPPRRASHAGAFVSASGRKRATEAQASTVPATATTIAAQARRRCSDADPGEADKRGHGQERGDRPRARPVAGREPQEGPDVVGPDARRERRGRAAGGGDQHGEREGRGGERGERCEREPAAPPRPDEQGGARRTGRPAARPMGRRRVRSRARRRSPHRTGPGARATVDRSPTRSGPMPAAGRRARPGAPIRPSENDHSMSGAQQVRGRGDDGGHGRRGLSGHRPVHRDPGQRRHRGQQHLLRHRGAAERHPRRRPQRLRARGFRAARRRAPCVRTDETSSEKNVPRSAGNAASAPPARVSGPTKCRIGERAETDREHRSEQDRVSARDADGPTGQRAPELLVLELLEALVEELLRALEPPRQPERGRHEPADVPVADRTHRLRADAPTHGAGQVDEVPRPRGEQVVGVLEPSRHGEVDRPAPRPSIAYTGSSQSSVRTP